MSENQSEKKHKCSGALKAHKQSLKAQKRNSIVKSIIATYIKKFLEAIESKDQKQSLKAFSKIQSVLLKAVKKNVIKLNKAARTCSRLNKKIKSLELASK